MKRRQYKRTNFIKKFFGVTVFLVLTYFIVGELFLPKDVPENEYQCQVFTADWMWIKPDGTKVPVEIPGKCDVKRNEVATIETTLPETVEDNTYLCFRSSKQDMQIFVDDILREEYLKDTTMFGNTSAVVYLFLKLNQEDAGKNITVNAKTDSSYTGIFY